MTVAERIAEGDKNVKVALEGRANYGEWAIARSILAVGSYLAALVEHLDEVTPPTPRDPLPPVAPEPEPFWARVELFGHSVRYGEIVEVEFAGRRFVEVRTPEIVGRVPLEGGGFDEKVIVAADSKRYHPNAVYAIDDQPEEEIRNGVYARAGLFRWEDGYWYVEPSKTAWSSPSVEDRDEYDPVLDEDDGDDLF